MRSLIPHFILENFAQQKFGGHFQAVSLFIDSSGFTQITATLQQHGKQGAEVLAEVLQIIFKPLIQYVYQQGGFIGNFSGDGFIALFPGQELLSYQHALAAAWQIRQHMAAKPNYNTRYGSFTFSVRASLADGRVEWGILPHEQTQAKSEPQIYYFCGQAIDRCIEGEQHIDGGQVALNQTVYSILRKHVLVEAVANYFWVKTIQGQLALPRKVNLPPFTPEHTAFFSSKLHQLTIQGEFRQVVTMFINLQVVDTRDPLPEFMRPCLDLLRDYGGHLARIARVGGQDAGYTLLLFWGAPTSFENDVERTLKFVLDLRQATPTVSYRVGMTYNMVYAGFVGSALREEYTCYGLSVNQAVRQMVAADWGDIWLDEALARQARTPARPDETRFDIDFVDHFAFKGFAEKQPVYVLRGELRGGLRGSLRGGQELSGPAFYKGSLIGRQGELNQLAEFVQPIFGGQFAGVATVYGEAGIGKSRLLHEFKQSCEAHLNGDAPTWFDCPTDEIRPQSLNPFRYFLRSYFDQSSEASQPQTESKNKARFTKKLESLISRLPDPALQGQLARAQPFLAALLDLHWPDSLYEQLEPKLRFENSLAALKNLLLAESQLQPVILALEDAHWLDKDSTQFLEYLTRNVTEYPLAVLIASREPFPSDLFDHDTPQHDLHLESLTADEIQSLAKEQLSAPVGPLLVEVLRERTNGNPFFVEQLLNYLVEQGLLLRDEAGLIPTETNGRIPADVRALLIARLDRLSSAVREVVQTAAVLGREFELPILALMLLNDPQVEARVKEAAREAIWSALTELRYLFRHALMRDAAYDIQLRARLHILHRLAGQSIEKLYAGDLTPYYADLFYHYGQAEDIEPELHYAKLAGEQAAARFANAEAVSYFSRALELTPETDYEERYTLLMAREKVYDLQGQREARRENLALLEEAAEALQDPQKQGQVAWCQAHYSISIGDYPGAALAAQTVVDISRKIGDRLLESQGLESLGLVTKNQGHYDRARAYFEQSLHLVQEIGNRPGEGTALGNLGSVCTLKGDYAEAKTYHQQGLRIARELGNRPGEGLSLTSLGNICGRQADYAQARGYYEQALRIFRELGYRGGEGLTLQNLGNIGLYQGDYAAARSYLEQSLHRRCEIGDQSGVGRLLNSLGGVSYRQGDNTVARTYFEQALHISRKIGDPVEEGGALHNLGLMAVNQGDYAQARAYFEPSLHLCQKTGARRLQGMNLLSLGNVCFYQGDYAEARVYFEQALDIKRELGDRAQGTLLNNIGDVFYQQGEYVMARTYFEQALSNHCEIGNKRGQGIALTNLGLVHVNLGQYAEALTYYHLLEANQDPRAQAILETAYNLLQEQAAKISDEALQSSFLENVAAHQEIVSKWEKRTEFETNQSPE